MVHFEKSPLAVYTLGLSMLFALSGVANSTGLRGLSTQAFKAKCIEAYGQVRDGRCVCPLSSAKANPKKLQTIDPLMGTCSREHECVRAFGEVTDKGCECVLKSAELGQTVLTNRDARTHSFAVCDLDRICHLDKFGQPTKEGCQCPLGGFVSLDGNQTCGLRLPLEASCHENSAADMAESLVTKFSKPEQKYSNWNQYVQALLLEPSIRQTIPGLHHIQRWSDLKTHDKGPTNYLDSLTPVNYSCKNGDGRLYPVYPEQFSKIYHLHLNGVYDARTMAQERGSGGQPYCEISSRGPKAVCQTASRFNFVLASDVFLDSCGNIYRAYWNARFLKNQESVADLFSKGRTQEWDPAYDNDFSNWQARTSSTYALTLDDVFMLSQPLKSRALKWQNLTFTDEVKAALYFRSRALFDQKVRLTCGTFDMDYIY